MENAQIEQTWGLIHQFRIMPPIVPQSAAFLSLWARVSLQLLLGVPWNYNRLAATCQQRSNFIIICIKNAGPVEEKYIEDFGSSYHCTSTFWKYARSNNVLTLQSVSPLWIFEPCRVRALWSIQSRILLETENSVLANRRFTKLHHGSDYTRWETCRLLSVNHCARSEGI